MARTRSAAYDDQRDAILERAAELFARQGFTATSMNEVAAACGVSKAGLYHYVRDKQELLFQITAGHVARLEQVIAEVNEEQRARVLDAQRRVVAAFGEAIGAVRPTLARNELEKPLAMLLFGMINWMFTWLRPDGSLTHEDMAPLVADLFFGGIGAVRKPREPRRPHALTPAA